jgi:hypothetical protein
MSPHADRRHRAELRAVARRLHPDLGGDPETYLAAVEAVDRAHGRTGSPDDVRARSAPTSRLRRRLRRARRAVRARLPRRMPGARRYARL